jgi:microcystin degradation protein MlrC
MTRIAVGGFLHETNTFAPTKATYDGFLHGGGWPPMREGAKLLEQMRNINVGIAGFIPAAEAMSWELVPTMWCAASPSAHVTEDAYERVAKAIVDGIKAAGAIDAVYLDLHGAMVAEHIDDGEGEIIARVREVIGGDLPLVVSLDLHANVTPRMVEQSDALIAYRTYPHIDMADTGRATAKHLALLLRAGHRFAKAFRQIPFLIPISWQCTNDEPCKSIYAKLAALESDAVPTLSFAPGFPAADFADCGASVFAYGRTQADADAAADRIAALVASHESDFDGRIFTPDDGVRFAMEAARRAGKPIVIADTQDNPGAGGDSDTTGMLRALVRNGATKAAIGIIVDPESAEAAHAAGTGAIVRLALGGKSGIPGDAPFEHNFVVEKLSDGKFKAPGPYFGGSMMNLGPSACLRVGGVRVVVGSRKAQLADQAMFRFVGIEPTEQSILVNKSSVHFRADFGPIAERIIICAAPGAMPADTSTLPWTRLRPGVRLKPNGIPFTPAPKPRSTSPAIG